MKLNRLFATAACIALFGSCAKELAPEPEIVTGEPISQISAFYAEEESKTELASDGLSVLWSPGDEIDIYYGFSQAKFTSINVKPSAVSMFTSDKSIMFIGAENSSEYIWGVYPYRDDNDYDGSSVTLTVPSEQTAVAGTFASGTFPSIGRSHTTSMGFYNVCGGIVFTVSQAGIQTIVFKGKNDEVIAGKVKVQFDSDGKPVVSEVVSGSSEVTVTAPEGGFQTGTQYYISLLPVKFNNGFELRFDKTFSTATFSTTASVEVKRSIFAKLDNKDAGLEWKLTVDPATASDLSAIGTANCYIVSQPGLFKFKATVKGGSTASVGTPAKAEVLWESFGTDVAPSKGDIVNNTVSLKDGYAFFFTNEPLKNGNAVIAVKDASDNILWSWHIWVCAGFNAESTAHVYNNNAGTMMDRNLGATSATKGDVHALGLMYQWGRKDPFLGGCQTSYSSFDNQQIAASTLSWPSSVSSNSSRGTIAYAVAHPTTFITFYSNNEDWYYTGSKSTDNTRWQTSDKTKGIYDPCPAGWRVPDGGSSGVWSEAGLQYTSSGGPWDSMNNGVNFGSDNGYSSSQQLGSASNIWYSSSGDRNLISGVLKNVGNNGNCWSCTPNGHLAYGLCCNFYGTIKPSDNASRAFGRSVRCVKEGSTKTDVVDLGLSVKWATCNIGANSPEQYGRYFAWGDVVGQTWNGSSWSGGGFSTYPSYELDSNNNLKPEYDAAHVLLGGKWRMPTKAEQQELIDNCTVTWTSNYNGTGVAGRIFTSKKTGYTDKSIFLPAAGYGNISGLLNAGSYGYYWSSTIGEDRDAWHLYFWAEAAMQSILRYEGNPVRPVLK